MEDNNLINSPCQKFSSLAIAYVAYQKWQNLYSPEVGFHRGTLFTELDKPFIGEEAVCKNDK